jgi:hypothetical protein
MRICRLHSRGGSHRKGTRRSTSASLAWKARLTVRIGNAVRRVLLQRLPALWPSVMSAIERGDKIIEIK